MRTWNNIRIFVVVLSAVFCSSLYGQAEDVRVMPPEKPLLVRQLPEFRIMKGEVLYARYCSFCHGDTGAGDGLNAFSIPVKPRNFSDQAAMAQRTEEELGLVIQAGGLSQGLSGYMPPFGKTLTALQIKYLVDFIGIMQGSGPE